MMLIEKLKEYPTYVEIGCCGIIASLLTLLITQIIKSILKKKKILNKDSSEIKKDHLLSKIGRTVAFIMYTTVFIIQEIILKHSIQLNEKFMWEMISGASITLITAKAIYSYLHQKGKQKEIYSQYEKTQQQKIILTRKKEMEK